MVSASLPLSQILLFSEFAGWNEFQQNRQEGKEDGKERNGEARTIGDLWADDIVKVRTILQNVQRDQ